MAMHRAGTSPGAEMARLQHCAARHSEKSLCRRLGGYGCHHVFSPLPVFLCAGWVDRESVCFASLARLKEHVSASLASRPVTCSRHML